MPRRLQCSLLCEDIEQEQLFRPILERRFGRGRVRVEPRKPQGGINFVFQQYARLVKGIIRRYPQEARGLVVVVDGDSEGLMSRLKELDQILAAAGHEKRAGGEKIATCIPCRNVETWELWLCGRRDLDQTTDYKADWQAEKRRNRASSDSAVEAWFARLSDTERMLEKDRLPALAAGRAEIDQLYSHADRD